MIYIWLNAVAIGLATFAGLLAAQLVDRLKGVGQWLVAALASAGWRRSSPAP